MISKRSGVCVFVCVGGVRDERKRGVARAVCWRAAAAGGALKQWCCGRGVRVHCLCAAAAARRLVWLCCRCACHAQRSCSAVCAPQQAARRASAVAVRAALSARVVLWTYRIRRCDGLVLSLRVSVDDAGARAHAERRGTPRHSTTPLAASRRQSCGHCCTPRRGVWVWVCDDDDAGARTHIKKATWLAM